MPMKKSKSAFALGFVVMAASFGRLTYNSPAVRNRQQSSHHRSSLTEQDLALLVGVDAGLRAQLEADRLALQHRGPLADRLLEPLLEIGEVFQLLAEILEAHDPRPDRHVGDRV